MLEPHDLHRYSALLHQPPPKELDALQCYRVLTERKAIARYVPLAVRVCCNPLPYFVLNQFGEDLQAWVPTKDSSYLDPLGPKVCTFSFCRT